MFYSATTRGFYPANFSGTDVPDDLVEVTDEDYAALFAGQSAGKVIAPDENGRPVLKDPPKPTADQIQAQANAEARTYLASTDWYVVRMLETGEPVPDDILAARAEARARVISQPAGQAE